MTPFIIQTLLALIFIILLIIIGMSDPGMLKRNENINSKIHEKKIKLVYKGNYIKTYICPICKITKPLRSHHCHDCDNCVLRFDHHCIWIGNCIGKGNYCLFYFSLIFVNLNCFFLLIFAILIFYHSFHNMIEGYKYTIIISLIPTIISFVVTFLTIIFSLGFLLYHTKLIMNNLSTKEDTKKLLNSQIGNYYNKGTGNNIKDFFNRKLPELNTLKQLNDKNEALIIKPKIKNGKKYCDNSLEKINERNQLSSNQKNSLTDIYSNKNIVNRNVSKTDSNQEKDSISSRREIKSLDLESSISIPKENSISFDIPKENSFHE